MSEDKRNDAGSGTGRDTQQDAPSGAKPAADTADTRRKPADKPSAGNQSAGGKAGGGKSQSGKASNKRGSAGAAGERADKRAQAGPTGAPTTGGDNNVKADKPTNDKTGGAGKSDAPAEREKKPAAQTGGAKTGAGATGGDTGRPQPAHIPAGSNRSRTAAAGGGRGGAPAPRADADGRGGGASGLALIALIIAVIAMLLSAWLWYRGANRMADWNQRLQISEQRMQSNLQGVIMPRLQKYDRGLRSLTQTTQKQAGQLAALQKQQSNKLASFQQQQNDKLAGLAQKIEATQSRIADLTKRVDRSGNRWQLHRIEALLEAGNRRLTLYHDARGAQQALQLADNAVARLADPRLHGVRQMIARDLTKVRGLPKPDIQGLSLALSAMLEQVPKLALAANVPSTYKSQTKGGSAQGGSGGFGAVDFSHGWQNFWDSLRRALAGMLTIRGGQSSQPALMPPDQAFFLNQNLQLQLRTARLALLQHNTQNYRQSLKTARQWLGQYYAGDSTAVSSMRAQLKKMADAKLDWQAPDISDSLGTLRQVMAKQAGPGQSNAGGRGNNTGNGARNGSAQNPPANQTAGKKNNSGAQKAPANKNANGGGNGNGQHAPGNAGDSGKNNGGAGSAAAGNGRGAS